jgi:cystinosin
MSHQKEHDINQRKQQLNAPPLEAFRQEAEKASSITPITSTTADGNKNSSSSAAHSSHADTSNSLELTLTSPLLNNTSYDTQESHDTTFSIDLHAAFHSILAIYSDQSGSCKNVTKGLSLMSLVGILCGLVMPKNPDLATPWYRTISSVIGYIYFVSWSVSFYPQLITNYEKKSIDGLSTDASILAFLNYTCYTIYNAFFFWNEGIRQEYKDRHGSDAKVTVQSNDVAFAMHALAMNVILISQIAYYGGYKSRPVSWITFGIGGLVVSLSLGYMLCIYLFDWLWIDFLYLMASVKLVLTILTYLPQVLLNYERKSTNGWNLWNVIFDCTGGVLSMLQLVLDSVDIGNIKNGLLGNVPKLILGLITLSFDVSDLKFVFSIGYRK